MGTPKERSTRIIIAGSRSISGEEAEFAVDGVMSQFTAGGANRGMYEIVTGGARGIDQAGKEWAERYDCSVTEIPLHRGGWFSLGEKKATLKPEVEELHRDVYHELANRGMRMDGLEVA